MRRLEVSERRMRVSNNKWFSALHCSRLDYTFETTLDRFKLDEFKKEVARATGEVIPKAEEFKGWTHTRSPVDYHAHFSFRWDSRKRFEATLSYFEGAIKPEPGDTGPFTETLVAWLGHFFNDRQIVSEVDA